MPPKFAIWLYNWEPKRSCPSHWFIFTSNYLPCKKGWHRCISGKLHYKQNICWPVKQTTNGHKSWMLIENDSPWEIQILRQVVFIHSNLLILTTVHANYGVQEVEIFIVFILPLLILKPLISLVYYWEIKHQNAQYVNTNNQQTFSQWKLI